MAFTDTNPKRADSDNILLAKIAQAVTNAGAMGVDEAYVQAQIDALINGAPGTLDTLNELAAALNDDANLATTLTNLISAKVPLDGSAPMTGELVTPGVTIKQGGIERINLAYSGGFFVITEVGQGAAASYQFSSDTWFFPALTASGTITGNLTGNVTGTVSGNAGSATVLQTARTINGTSFNGSGNIVIPPYQIDTHSTLTYAGTTNIDFMAENFRTETLTGNVTFTTSNLAAGRSITIKIIGDGSLRTFTFPAWKFVGAAAPVGLAANKIAVLTLTAFGTTDATVVAAYSAEI